MRLFRRSLATLDAAKLQIEKVAQRKTYPKPEDLVFGKVFSDHMLKVEWDSEKGWAAPQITPYAPFTLDPSSVVFHYGFECFEGLKAFRDVNNHFRMFRADKNMERIQSSSARICLPTFDPQEGVKLLEEFVRLEHDVVPKGKGYSLYLRPTVIGTNASLGIAPPTKAMFYVIASPVGPYYPTGLKAIKLEATDTAVRAWPGGVGNRKLGANYAPCVLPQKEAAARGFQQNLWLFDGHLTEVGTMNLFVVFRNPDGTQELATPPLDGTILEGITRLSILELARERLDPAKWQVSERLVKIDELVARQAKGELVEVFGAGTAAIVSPVKEISYHGVPITVPLQPGKECGPLTELVQSWIQDIQYGVEDHPFCKKIM